MAGPPCILDKRAEHTTRALSLIHVSALSGVRNIQNERRNWVAGIHGVVGVRIPRLLRRESPDGRTQIPEQSIRNWTCESRADVSAAKMQRVVPYNLGQTTVELMTVSGLGLIHNVVPSAGVAVNSRVWNKLAPRRPRCREVTGKSCRKTYLAKDRRCRFGE